MPIHPARHVPIAWKKVVALGKKWSWKKRELSSPSNSTANVLIYDFEIAYMSNTLLLFLFEISIVLFIMH